jgi:mono/diheme cytochrome c family protein
LTGRQLMFVLLYLLANTVDLALAGESATNCPDVVDVSPGPPPPVDADRGVLLYRQLCATCHGRSGKGDGPAARRMEPRPRDFNAAQYKLRSTEPGSTAVPLDLFRTISTGMPGTSMPAWSGLSSDDRWQLVYYLQTLTDRFAGAPAVSLHVPEPPASTPARIERGATVYGRLACGACHGGRGDGNGPASRQLTDSTGNPIRPFDMSHGKAKGGFDPASLYRVIHSGIEGTPMPSFHDQLDEEETWDLVFYVRSLAAPPDHEGP